MLYTYIFNIKQLQHKNKMINCTTEDTHTKGLTCKCFILKHYNSKKSNNNNGIVEIQSLFSAYPKEQNYDIFSLTYKSPVRYVIFFSLRNTQIINPP